MRPAPRAVRWLGDVRVRRVSAGALLLCLLLILIVVTPLRQGFAQVFAPPDTTATVSPIPTATAPVILGWAGLEVRPLHFPTLAQGAACPVSPVSRFYASYGLGLGDGPIFPFAFAPDGQPAAYIPPSQGPKGLIPGFTKLFWAIAPSYRGPALVRGAQLDGLDGVFFNGGHAQDDVGDWASAPLLSELQLAGDGMWTVDGAYVRLLGPGCYAFQVDGASFSQTLIFRVSG
jgi:hypothetical protein